MLYVFENLRSEIVLEKFLAKVMSIPEAIFKIHCSVDLDDILKFASSDTSKLNL